MSKKDSATIDAVDAILKQWSRERPELDLSPMAAIGRIQRCAALLQIQLDQHFAQYGLSLWEFDMLAALRRSGQPYCLSPTELFSTLMVTSGTMTHRLKRMESTGLIQRVANPADARSMLVKLTEQGLKLIDQMITGHVENEQNILADMSHADIELLDQQLAKLLSVLEAQRQS